MAENFEYRQRKKDYNLLINKLSDLEHRYRQLQQEKMRFESNTNDYENQEENNDYQKQLRSYIGILHEIEWKIKDHINQSQHLKAITEAKTQEISNCKRELAIIAVDANTLLKVNQELKGKHDIESAKLKSLKAEVDELLHSNNTLAEKEGESEARTHENEYIINEFNERIEIVNKQIYDITQIMEKDEDELTITLTSQEKLKRQLDEATKENMQIQNENKELLIKMDSIELELERYNKKQNEMQLAIENHERELKIGEDNMRIIVEKNEDMLKKTHDKQTENEQLKIVLEKNKNEMELQRILRNEEMSRQLIIKENNRKLADDMMNKNMETKLIKDQLEIQQIKKEELESNHFQATDEFKTLKEHAEALKTQNIHV